MRTSVKRDDASVETRTEHLPNISLERYLDRILSNKLHSVALVRKRPPLAGEVSANFCG
jgi:hypothetical protein